MLSKIIDFNKKFILKNLSKQNSKGFTILELIGTIFIISIGLIGIINIIPLVLSTASTNSSQLIAAYLAQEGMEIVRNIRDGNWLEQNSWDEGLTNCSTGCEVDYLCTTVEDPSPTNPNPNVQHCFRSYGSGAFLKIDSTNGFYKYNCPACSDTQFKRQITIQPDPLNPNNILIVKVNVSWEGNQFIIQGKLYKWY